MLHSSAGDFVPKRRAYTLRIQDPFSFESIITVQTIWLLHLYFFLVIYVTVFLSIEWTKKIGTNTLPLELYTLFLGDGKLYTFEKRDGPVPICVAIGFSRRP